jgi:hypothetical protein
MKKGRRSYLWYTLFPDSPVAKVWSTYQSRGAKAAVEVYRKLRKSIPEARRAEVLRHVFLSSLLRENEYADAEVFFTEWVEVDGGKDHMTDLHRGLIELTSGEPAKAKRSFAKQIEADQKDEMAQSFPPITQAFLDRLEGKAPPEATTRLKLEGHTDAKFVCVQGLGWMAISEFLLRTDKGWAGDFALPPGTHHYAFLVDGEKVLDPANPRVEEIDTEDGRMTMNTLVVE